MSQTTLTVPVGVVEAAHFIERNFWAFLGALLIAVLASLVTEVIKRKGLKPRLNLEEDKKRLQKLVTWVLALVSVLFTFLGYITTAAHFALPALTKYPVLAEACLSIYGASNFLYNVRLNKTWQKWADRLSSWTKSSTKTPVTATPLVDLPQQTPVVASEDQL